MADSTTPKITLHTYFRSSCSARLRIALNLKSIPYTSIAVNLLNGEQLTPENRTLNPSATVPTLIITHPTKAPTTITQSLAALEYLEETTLGSSHALLPPASDPEARALVRTLTDILSCDIQPVTNLKILKRVAPFGVDRAAWSKELIEDGFRAYEAIAARTAGVFSVGDSITMADVCLVPAVWGAERAGVKVQEFPTIWRVAQRLELEDAVKRAHWRTQPDTPEEFRMEVS
ncbi:maleylacetoacetate isomerase MaiA [Aspergillus clavatus NRRL 1]|uniref:Maleylacetoacetate isomerase MaiA n=1 Tax=Aspergillus clavatus (strain ATCC 1007 / CBS 513.65 / DSM 816 / NCTC 3887 / NRRL 1 / QM 1276 / 107) TaxID=344612 RepID=A1CEN7_ASPCL|nr:maleylacetoacetate isomerase MaiA [Aspergillus clavatus NRRL 1]EAW11336.1 maleylacetoacetate isomerase MaiA [Aspergillus clavatus NRRL 1]